MRIKGAGYAVDNPGSRSRVAVNPEHDGTGDKEPDDHKYGWKPAKMIESITEKYLFNTGMVKVVWIRKSWNNIRRIHIHEEQKQEKPTIND